MYKYSDTEWEFVYPEKICFESISEEYWSAVESLGYEDLYAEPVFKSLIKKVQDNFSGLFLKFLSKLSINLLEGRTQRKQT